MIRNRHNLEIQLDTLLEKRKKKQSKKYSKKSEQKLKQVKKNQGQAIEVYGTIQETSKANQEKVEKVYKSDHKDLL